MTLPQFTCEVCEKELSYEWVHHHFDMLDYHALCSDHRDAYLKAKNSVIIAWDGEKFVAYIGETK